MLVHAQHNLVRVTVCFIPSGFGPVRNCTSAHFPSQSGKPAHEGGPPQVKRGVSVCTYGAWELSSPNSFGGGGREVPLAHIISQAAQHQSVWNFLFFQRNDRNFYKLVEGERIHSWTFIDIIVVLGRNGSFTCKSWCKVKRSSLTNPHERVSRTALVDSAFFFRQQKRGLQWTAPV